MFSISLSLSFYFFSSLDSFMKTRAMNLLFFADNTSTVSRSVWQQILLIVFIVYIDFVFQTRKHCVSCTWFDWLNALFNGILLLLLLLLCYWVLSGCIESVMGLLWKGYRRTYTNILFTILWTLQWRLSIEAHDILTWILWNSTFCGKTQENWWKMLKLVMLFIKISVAEKMTSVRFFLLYKFTDFFHRFNSLAIFLHEIYTKKNRVGYYPFKIHAQFTVCLVFSVSNETQRRFHLKMLAVWENKI